MTTTDRIPPAPAVAPPRLRRLRAPRRLLGLRLAPAYVGVVTAVRLVLCLTLDATTRAAVVQDASTNVANLVHGRVGTLVTSALLVEGPGCLPALLALGAVLGVAELTWGALTVAAVFAYGHVAATLLVFAGLVTGLSLHELCRGVATAADVGPSYGGVAVLGALLGARALPHALRLRLAAVALALGGVLLDRTFTDVGHLVALLLGFVAGGLVEGVRRGRGAAAAAR